MVEKLLDRLLASRLKPTVIVATITPAIRPYSSAVTARRSSFSSSQVFTYSIMVNSHRCIAQMRLPGICLSEHAQGDTTTGGVTQRFHRIGLHSFHEDFSMKELLCPGQAKPRTVAETSG
jgi:hypothetical protein